jgi:hypothetical protein
MPAYQGFSLFLFEAVQIIAPLNLRLSMSKESFSDMASDAD